MTIESAFRIGELSRRVGVSPELLRAWERRYGLLEPARTDGGLRLYSAADERRVRTMQSALGRGLAAAEAARVARGSEAGPDAPAPRLRVAAADLTGALDEMDAGRAHDVLDDLLGAFTLETVLADVVVPYLRELGARWERGDASVAQEHFASHLLRARLLGLARGWERGDGPLAVLGCLPGELHDLSLIVFALALRGQGWRIAFLGGDTPLESMAEAAARLDADAVVVTAVTTRFDDHREELARLARARAVWLAGAAAREATPAGCRVLDVDPVTAAGLLSARA